MKQSNNWKKIILASASFIALVAILAAVFIYFRPQGSEGSKKIVVEVINSEETSKEITLKTDAEFLRQALEENNLVKGTESEYGLFITEVDGIVADSSKQEWWAITQDGEMVFYGVDEIAINDGDHYELTLTVGY